MTLFKTNEKIVLFISFFYNTQKILCYIQDADELRKEVDEYSPFVGVKIGSGATSLTFTLPLISIILIATFMGIYP